MPQPNETFRKHLPTASDARAVRTRASLRGALLELLQSRPMEQINIRDIAEAAGIGTATFYRHHPTKESLLNDLAAAEMRRVVELTMPIMDTQSPLAGSVALFTYVSEHRPLWSTFLTGGAASALRAEFLDISLGIAAKRSRHLDWPAAELATRLVVAGTIEILIWWLRHAKRVSIAEAAELHVRLIVMPAVRSEDPGAHSTLPRQAVARRVKARR
jgi:AcrR family transcriptional regulator